MPVGRADRRPSSVRSRSHGSAGEARIVAAPHRQRQVVAAQERGDRGRHVVGGRRRASTRAGRGLDHARRTARRRSCGGKLPARRDDAARDARASRSATAARRGASRAGDAERAADRAEDGVARAHRLAPALAPLRLEGRALRRREVAVLRPAAGERQRAEAAAPAADQASSARGAAASPADRAAAGAAKKAQSARPARTVAGDRCRSNSRSRQWRISLRQRDAHRADALAAAAEGRGVGQVAGLVDADQAAASAPRPSGRDRPSHRRGRRPRDRPGSGSCRRRSGCSAACPGTRCRACAERPLSSRTT